MEKKENIHISVKEVLYTPVDMLNLREYTTGEYQIYLPVKTDKIRLYPTHPENGNIVIIHQAPTHSQMIPDEPKVRIRRRIPKNVVLVVHENKDINPASIQYDYKGIPHANLSARKPVAIIAAIGMKKRVRSMLQNSAYSDIKVHSQKDWIKVREGKNAED